jgi:hypothetical protein
VDENNIEDLKTIPNIRETIGMVSIGKKLLFVEGNTTSIDRNVFATIAKAAKIDVAIIPSNSCSNINNMSTICDTLEKGLFGVELFMVRDRDALADEQVAIFDTKSKGRLIFLPFYHIENAFLHPRAIEVIAKKILLSKAPNAEQIEEKMIELAKQQLNQTIALYVKSEMYFQAGNFDVTPRMTVDATTTVSDLTKAISNRKNELLAGYNTDFSEEKIEERLNQWKTVLETSIRSGWSADARKYFIGKRILKEVSNSFFGSKNILLYEHIINSKEEPCQQACKELTDILSKI